MRNWWMDGTGDAASGRYIKEYLALHGSSAHHLGRHHRDQMPGYRGNARLGLPRFQMTRDG